MFRDENLHTVLTTVTSVVFHSEQVSPVEHYQGREVGVVSRPVQAIQADGEVLPWGSVTVKILPSAMPFIVPGAHAP